MKLSILMPAYNEQRTIRAIVERVMESDVEGITDKELVIVDDGSTDDTGRIIGELVPKHKGRIIALRHDRNMGKGAAVRTAAEHMTGDVCLIQDADLEYDPAEYSTLIHPIVKLGADCVFGSRFATSGLRTVRFFWHAVGNRILTCLSNCFTDLDLTDMETCYKAFRTSVLRTIPLRSNRFGIEPEITAKCAKRGLKIYEVPVSYRGRTYLEGKKICWKDGFLAVFTILKYWLIDDSFSEDYGHAILNEMQEAPNFSRWLIDVVHPYLGETVVEVGSGIGNLTRILSLQHHVVATDYDQKYVNILTNAFAGNEFVHVEKWDMQEAWPGTPPETDSVFCSNVLEHIEHDAQALRNARSLLGPGGRLVLVVPKSKRLYCGLDAYVMHHRRYDRKDIEQLMQQAGFRIERMISFNKAGVVGWLVKGKLFKRKTLGRLSLKLFNVCVPLIRRIDRHLPWPGLSWLVVGSADGSIHNSERP